MASRGTTQPQFLHGGIADLYLKGCTDSKAYSYRHFFLLFIFLRKTNFKCKGKVHICTVSYVGVFRKGSSMCCQKKICVAIAAQRRRARNYCCLHTGREMGWRKWEFQRHFQSLCQSWKQNWGWIFQNQYTDDAKIIWLHLSPLHIVSARNLLSCIKAWEVGHYCWKCNSCGSGTVLHL